VSVTRAGGDTEPGMLSVVTDVKARDGRRRNKIVGAAKAKAVNQDTCGRPTAIFVPPVCPLLLEEQRQAHLPCRLHGAMNLPR
jgi:hypothetical protein